MVQGIVGGPELVGHLTASAAVNGLPSPPVPVLSELEPAFPAAISPLVDQTLSRTARLVPIPTMLRRGCDRWLGDGWTLVDHEERWRPPVEAGGRERNSRSAKQPA